VPAIRIRGLGRSFGAPIEMDGAARPWEAWRSLLRIAGFHLTPRSGQLQATLASGGDVLRDISLDIEWGSVVCLTGPPGSGKSLLLRILGGVIAPTSGSVEIYGPVRTLLSVGDNLDMRLTAYENIHASAPRHDPDQLWRLVDEVLEFAELRGFEHVPLRTYSTGMVLRLSVALALGGRPAIVLADDVLDVGDIGFRQKVVDRLLALKEEGCTMVLALGDEALLPRLATRVVTLAGGRIVDDGPPCRFDDSAVAGSGIAEVEWHGSEYLPEDEVMALRSVDMDETADDVGWVTVRATFESKAANVRCRPVVVVGADSGALFRSVYPEFLSVPDLGVLTFALKVPACWLPAGSHVVGVSIVTLRGDRVFSLKTINAGTLVVRRPSVSEASAMTQPLLLPPMQWEIERVGEIVV
jgi:ABC-type polysaccharide/polyol phosphate transport system ATPase subunit